MEDIVDSIEYSPPVIPANLIAKKINCKYELIIIPKMSFGTGHHESTQLIIEYILDSNLTDLNVCDVGSGTGILSILSEKKGAKKKRVHADKGHIPTEAQHAQVGRKRPGGESRLPAAIVPPPGLGKIICMRKICKKFDARSMQVYFFAKYCLKSLISPTASQNEHPEGAK